MKWEYLAIDFADRYTVIGERAGLLDSVGGRGKYWNYPIIELVLNALGQDGWELVASDDRAMILKRPIVQS